MTSELKEVEMVFRGLSDEEPDEGVAGGSPAEEEEGEVEELDESDEGEMLE